jgi:uncharacterized membrane protein HdeD (DUF308 family)
MNPQPELVQISLKSEEYLRVKHLWAWFFFLGGALVCVGGLAIAAAFSATLATVLVFGILLLGGGAVQLVNAILARTWKGFALHLLAGVLYLVVGGLMVANPRQVAADLTLMLAAVFILAGAMRLIYGVLHSFPGRGWAILGGFLGILLGISIWRQWPYSGEWVIGLLVGIDLVYNGWMWMVLGMLVKTAPRESGPTEGRSPPSVVSSAR